MMIKRMPLNDAEIGDIGQIGKISPFGSAVVVATSQTWVKLCRPYIHFADCAMGTTLEGEEGRRVVRYIGLEEWIEKRDSLNRLFDVTRNPVE